MVLVNRFFCVNRRQVLGTARGEEGTLRTISGVDLRGLKMIRRDQISCDICDKTKDGAALCDMDRCARAKRWVSYAKAGTGQVGMASDADFHRR